MEESFHDHNIVQFQGAFFGIPQSLGRVDFSKREDIERPEIIKEQDLKELKTRIRGKGSA